MMNKEGSDQTMWTRRLPFPHIPKSPFFSSAVKVFKAPNSSKIDIFYPRKV